MIGSLDRLVATHPRQVLLASAAAALGLVIVAMANWSFVSFTAFALVAALFLFKPAFFTGDRSS